MKPICFLFLSVTLTNPCLKQQRYQKKLQMTHSNVYVWSLLIMRLDSNLRFRPLSSEHDLTSWLAWKRIGLALPCMRWCTLYPLDILLSRVSILPFNVIETCSLDVWPGWKNNGDINQVPRLSEDLISQALFKVVHCRLKIIEWNFF